MPRTELAGTMAGRAREVVVREMHRWWRKENEVLEKAAGEEDYVALMCSFIDHVRARAVYHGTETSIDALVRRIVPDLPQFIRCFEILRIETLNPPGSPSPTTLTVTPVRRGVVGGGKQELSPTDSVAEAM